MKHGLIPKKLERLFHIIESISKVCMLIAVGCLLLLITLILASSLGRYLFNSPILNSDEIAGYLLMSIVVLGLAYTLREQRHIRVELIANNIKPRGRAILNLIMASIGLIWALAVLVGSWLVWTYYIENKTISSMGTGILLCIPSFVLVIGSTALTLQLFLEILKRVFIVLEIKQTPDFADTSVHEDVQRI